MLDAERQTAQPTCSSPDGLHMNAKGYELWTSLLAPTADESVKVRSAFTPCRAESVLSGDESWRAEVIPVVASAPTSLLGDRAGIVRAAAAMLQHDDEGVPRRIGGHVAGEPGVVGLSAAGFGGAGLAGDRDTAANRTLW